MVVHLPSRGAIRRPEATTTVRSVEGNDLVTTLLGRLLVELDELLAPPPLSLLPSSLEEVESLLLSLQFGL